MGIVKLLSFQHAVFTVAWNCGSQDMPDPSRAFGRIPGIFIRKRPVRHAILCEPLPAIRPADLSILAAYAFKKRNEHSPVLPRLLNEANDFRQTLFCNNLWFCDTNRRKMYGDEP